MFNRSSGSLPLTRSQLSALAGAAGRQLAWGQPRIAREAAEWKARAERIPDDQLRQAALEALATKRGHTDGAGLFATLVPHRDKGLLRLLVAYENIWDYLDTVHELVPTENNGRQLHRALVVAIDPGRELDDWYRYHPWKDDGGYLDELVTACQSVCRCLPSFALVQSALLREAWRAQVLALNHIVEPARRDCALRAWAETEFPTTTDLEWYELTGAASASLVMHVLFALAADPSAVADDVDDVYATYWPWFSLATTMLDSYVDRDEDRANGNHSYFAHYPDVEVAVLRVRSAIERSALATRNLRNGDRHAVLLAGMCAMYLSKDSARRHPRDTRALAGAGGTLTLLLMPILRLWRVRYRQRAA